MKIKRFRLTCHVETADHFAAPLFQCFGFVLALLSTEKTFYWKSLEWQRRASLGDDGFWKILMWNTRKVDLKPSIIYPASLCAGWGCPGVWGWLWDMFRMECRN